MLKNTKPCLYIGDGTKVAKDYDLNDCIMDSPKGKMVVSPSAPQMISVIY
jgi:hypothetical protein